MIGEDNVGRQGASKESRACDVVVRKLSCRSFVESEMDHSLSVKVVGVVHHRRGIHLFQLKRGY